MQNLTDGAKLVLIAVGAVVAVILISLAGLYVTGTLQKKTADFRGDVAATEQVFANGTFRLQSYDYFFNLCAAIQTDEARLELFPADAEDEITKTNRRAIFASRVSKVYEYNAAVRREKTVGAFRDTSLPDFIDPTQENTTCVA